MVEWRASSVLVVVMVVVGVVEGVSITSIVLTQDGVEVSYLNLARTGYVLTCNHDVPQDKLVNITWTLDDYGPVYIYKPSIDDDVVTVNPPLQTAVLEEGPAIQYTLPRPIMAGFYTCQVYHTDETTLVNPLAYEYTLSMWALVHEEYSMEATFENCTVYWSFMTPAMYPRPDVTCGYLNATSGQVMKVPGGLVFHQYMNYTWSVFMTETPVMIDEIPHDTTLFCRTNIPFVNYTEDSPLPRDATNTLLYQEVDDRGCPALPLVDEHMVVELLECDLNCRGECHQTGSINPVVALFKCGSGYEAYWEHNDTTTYNWVLRVTCTNPQNKWTSQGGQPTDTLELPYCIYNGATTLASSVAIVAMSLLLNLYH